MNVKASGAARYCGRQCVYLYVRQKADSSDIDMLVRELRRGSQAAYIEAMRRYGRLVASVIASMIADRRDVEELTQDTFVRAFAAIESYRPDETRFPTWLARIACNAAVDRLRRSGLRFAEVSVDAMADVADDSAAEPPLDAEYLAEAMERLAPHERLALTLVYYDGLSVEDAAYVLRLSAPVLSSRLYRLRKKLASLIYELKKCR